MYQWLFKPLSKVIAVIIVIIIGTMGLAACSSGGGEVLPAEDDMVTHFIDVGQADCTLVISQGEAMLIDAGNRPDEDLILSYLDSVGVDSLKYIVFTHPHEDHIGSGEAIVSAIDVEKVFMLDEYDEGIEGYLKEEIEYRDIETVEPFPGDTAKLGECKIEFVGPFYEYSDTNDDSICLKITHGENSMLFTGDAGSEPEKDMLEAGMDLEVDVLQAGHHGSSTSNTYQFLREVNPRYVVISCEKGNMYGHPHRESLGRFNDVGAEIFRTDTQGTIVAVSDGMNFEFTPKGKDATRPHIEEFEDANYIGNVNSRKYHLPTCSGLPAEDNRSYFMTKEAAEDAGYEPCGNCRP
ncbi:MAG: MBL fold metallo-hydrolase [Bacillota bacterium]|nr:MBL fold metallo-hydrolase [Bacillota bacterium]